MAEYVSSIRIPDLLVKLRDGDYLVPKFQRDFVWTVSDVSGLLVSIINSRPIGMLTLWEQPDNSGLDLEHVSVPDTTADGEEGLKYFGDPKARTNKAYAILDGRQRSTAIAMAFGGLSADDARRKFSGKFFLDIVSDNASERVVFKKSVEVEKLNLSTLSNCITRGLLPFEMDFDQFKNLDDQWMKYAVWISNPKFYPNSELPNESELERRLSIIHSAFQGIIDTTLAQYSVPKQYDLGTICEIFETLNTTGTRVSTVDLIHSWLYADTTMDTVGPFLLREWIKDLGQQQGAIGWADHSDRPELIAQFVTATYLAEDNPPTPRTIGGKTAQLTSVKSGDLLATPTPHWKSVKDRTTDFAQYIGAFQACVGKRPFALKHCPYPISAAIYIALRWKNDTDAQGWALDDVNALYRAFFWRNALSSRYDQGFLTKMATDLKLLIKLLQKRSDFTNFGEWALHCAKILDESVSPIVSEEVLIESLLDAKPAGALGRALMLPVLTSPVRDLLDSSKKIDLVSASDGAFDVHHIYPRAWIKDNVSDTILSRWIENHSGEINSIANLTPMLRVSNLKWKAKIPGRALEDAGVKPDTQRRILESHFISDEAYANLLAGSDGLPTFWKKRAKLMAAHLTELMRVHAG